MKFRVLIDSAARGDLQAITSYLSERSEEVADRFVSSAWAAIDDLLNMSGKGSLKRMRSSGGQALRSWRVPGFHNYLIFYFIEGKLIVVIGVLHGARNLRRILRDR